MELREVRRLEVAVALRGGASFSVERGQAVGFMCIWEGHGSALWRKIANDGEGEWREVSKGARERYWTFWC